MNDNKEGRRYANSKVIVKTLAKEFSWYTRTLTNPGETTEDTDKEVSGF